MHTDLPLGLLDDLLGNVQPETDTLVVELRGPLQLSEAREELWHVLLTDALATVLDMHDELALVGVEAVSDINSAVFCEFYCVFDEVDQDLLEAPLVSDQALRRLVFNAV